MCVSGQYHQYCSAHDEWLILKLYMYVRYHTVNNVSNFGSDPIKLNKFNCVCIRGHVAILLGEWLIMKLCMYVWYHTANNVSNFGGDPVTQLHFITIFNVMSPYCSAHDEWLIMKLCMYHVRYHTANGYKS